MFGAFDAGSAPQGLATIPEIIWEAFLGIYLTFWGFKALIGRLRREPRRRTRPGAGRCCFLTAGRTSPKAWRGRRTVPSTPRVRRRCEPAAHVAIDTPMEDEMRLHGSAKLVVPLPAMTAPRANTWPEALGM